MNERHYDAVEDAALDAHLAAWDGCHKIYLAMDAEQADWFRANYEHIADGPTAATVLATVVGWWDESCPLRFVNAVTTNHADPNAGFTDVVPQFDEDDDDLEDEDDDELVSL